MYKHFVQHFVTQDTPRKSNIVLSRIYQGRQQTDYHWTGCPGQWPGCHFLWWSLVLEVLTLEELPFPSHNPTTEHATFGFWCTNKYSLCIKYIFIFIYIAFSAEGCNVWPQNTRSPLHLHRKMLTFTVNVALNMWPELAWNIYGEFQIYHKETYEDSVNATNTTIPHIRKCCNTLHTILENTVILPHTWKCRNLSHIWRCCYLSHIRRYCATATYMKIGIISQSILLIRYSEKLLSKLHKLLPAWEPLIRRQSMLGDTIIHPHKRIYCNLFRYCHLSTFSEILVNFLRSSPSNRSNETQISFAAPAIILIEFTSKFHWSTLPTVGKENHDKKMRDLDSHKYRKSKVKRPMSDK